MFGKKYELLVNVLIERDGGKLCRIRALRDFGSVKAGDLGGYVETEANLSHEGNAWVAEQAQVYGQARVFDDALVSGDARVFGSAMVGAAAHVFGKAWVFEDALVCGWARVYGDARVRGNGRVGCYTRVGGNEVVTDFVSRPVWRRVIDGVRPDWL